MMRKNCREYLSGDVKDIGTKVIQKMLCIHDDVLGAHNSVLATSPGANLISDIYESHTSLLHTVMPPKDATGMARSTARKCDMYLRFCHEAMAVIRMV
jgi:hypothetical protein